MQFLTFVKRLSVYSVIILLASYAALYFIPKVNISSSLPWLIIFFFSVTVSVFYFILRASEQRFAKFVTTFMLTTFLKLMLYLAVLLIYIFLIRRNNAVPFIGAFFIYYLLFTVFETVYMVIVTKDNKYRDKGND
jgi:hypothetical protein